MDEEGNVNMKNINTLFKPEIVDPRTYDKCQGCSLYSYCNAGCTYSQLIMDGDNVIKAEPVDSVCQLFHIIFKETFHINEVLKYNKTYQNFLQQIIKPLGVRTCTN
jgi:sulfatase maturation enzyme AslB (radical SAM superfamily)